MLLQPSDVGAQGGLAHFDAPVIALHALRLPQRRLGVVQKELHVLKERTLVGFEGQHVVAALLDHLGRDLALAGHGVGGDHHALEAEQLEELRDRRDLVRRVLDRPLAEHKALLHGPS